jgi:hypothetical protein
MTTVTLTLGNQLIVKRDGREVARMDIASFSAIDPDLADVCARAQYAPGTEVIVPNWARNVRKPRHSVVYGVKQ